MSVDLSMLFWLPGEYSSYFNNYVFEPNKGNYIFIGLILFLQP